MSAAPSDPFATPYLDPATIERVVAMDDVLARNAAITHGYHELAHVVGAILGRDHANWLVFGQWASAEARRSITGETVPPTLRPFVGADVAAAVAAGNAAVFGDVAPPFIRFVRAFADPAVPAEPVRARAALVDLGAHPHLAASEDLRRERMGYIFTLLRSHQCDPSLFDLPPGTPDAPRP